MEVQVNMAKTAMGYVDALSAAIKSNRGNLRSHYRNREGCLKLARETGYGFRDFPGEQHDEAIKASYAKVCKALFGPNPPVSATTWKETVKGQLVSRCR